MDYIYILIYIELFYYHDIVYIYIYLLKYIALCHNTYIFTSTINTQTKASAA